MKTISAPVLLKTVQLNRAEESYGSAKGYGDEYYYDSEPNYKFAYGVEDKKTGDVKSQEEIREGDYVKGEYSLIDADNKLRVVKYQAGPKTGFEATVIREPIATKGYYGGVSNSDERKLESYAIVRPIEAKQSSESLLNIDERKLAPITNVYSKSYVIAQPAEIKSYGGSLVNIEERKLAPIATSYSTIERENDYGYSGYDNSRTYSSKY